MRTTSGLLPPTVQEAGVLVREAIMVLPPHRRREAQVDRGHLARARPSSPWLLSSHFACWFTIESITCTNAS